MGSAYGLSFRPLPPAAQDAMNEPTDADRELGVEFDGVVSARSQVGLRITAERAHFAFGTASSLAMTRNPLRVTFALDHEVETESLVHPLLSIPAAVANLWLGRTCLHAGAVLIGGRAWAIVADRGGGKSTTVAMLVRAGCSFVTDDLLVADDSDCVFPGPRAIDLRASAAAILGGRALESVGSRQRWRINPDPGRSARGPTPLAGFVHLSWSENRQIAPMPFQERLQRLANAAALGLPPPGRDGYLPMAALPAFELARPPDDLASSAELIVGLIDRLATV